MIYNIENYGDLKKFIDGLPEEKLKDPVILSMDEAPYMVMDAAIILDEDHINPTGEMDEPISLYTDDDSLDVDVTKEPITARKGDVYLSVEIKKSAPNS